MSHIKEIYAVYNNKTIRIYQAYNSRIADEAVREGKFGESFNLNRMTWIKPSFLWMMYRSNWASKKDQDNILAIDILGSGFDEFLSQAVLTTDESAVYGSFGEWKESFMGTEVYCQWDPDRDIGGRPIGRRAIQIGIKGQAVKNYIEKYIVSIMNITPDVIKWRNQIKTGSFKKDVLPKERVYPVDKSIRKLLDMD